MPAPATPQITSTAKSCRVPLYDCCANPPSDLPLPRARFILPLSLLASWGGRDVANRPSRSDVAEFELARRSPRLTADSPPDHRGPDVANDGDRKLNHSMISSPKKGGAALRDAAVAGCLIIPVSSVNLAEIGMDEFSANWLCF